MLIGSPISPERTVHISSTLIPNKLIMVTAIMMNPRLMPNDGSLYAVMTPAERAGGAWCPRAWDQRWLQKVLPGAVVPERRGVRLHPHVEPPKIQEHSPGASFSEASAGALGYEGLTVSGEDGRGS